MAQFDVYENPNRGSEEPVEYLLDLQAGMFDDLPTRVVAPLVSPEKLQASMSILNPKVFVHHEPYIRLSHLLATIPANHLGAPVDSVSLQREAIIGSIDFLFTGV